MENNAVGLVNLNLLAVHDEQSLLKINLEERHRVGLMVEGYKMFVVGEKRGVFGILPAYRQAQNLVEIAVVGIDPEDHNRIVARV